eukprot:3613662-Amphidinium_carterae.1
MRSNGACETLGKRWFLQEAPPTCVQGAPLAQQRGRNHPQMGRELTAVVPVVSTGPLKIAVTLAELPLFMNDCCNLQIHNTALQKLDTPDT